MLEDGYIKPYIKFSSWVDLSAVRPFIFTRFSGLNFLPDNRQWRMGGKARDAAARVTSELCNTILTDLILLPRLFVIIIQGRDHSEPMQHYCGQDAKLTMF